MVKLVFCVFFYGAVSVGVDMIFKKLINTSLFSDSVL